MASHAGASSASRLGALPSLTALTVPEIASAVAATGAPRYCRQNQQQQALNSHLGHALIKKSTLNGVPRGLEAIISISHAYYELDEDKALADYEASPHLQASLEQLRAYLNASFVERFLRTCSSPEMASALSRLNERSMLPVSGGYIRYSGYIRLQCAPLLQQSNMNGVSHSTVHGST